MMINIHDDGEWIRTIEVERDDAGQVLIFDMPEDGPPSVLAVPLEYAMRLARAIAAEVQPELRFHLPIGLEAPGREGV